MLPLAKKKKTVAASDPHEWVGSISCGRVWNVCVRCVLRVVSASPVWYVFFGVNCSTFGWQPNFVCYNRNQSTSNPVNRIIG